MIWISPPLVVFSQKVEVSNLKKEKERTRVDNEVLDGHGGSKNRKEFSRQGYDNKCKD